MNLLSFAATGMVPTPSSDGGGGHQPPDSAEITIVVDALDRTPKAEPESAWVKPEGEIVWTSADSFEIVLMLLWSGERVGKKSKPGGPNGLHEVRVKAGKVYGKYPYGIKVEGGPEIDPDVIIGPRMHL